MVFIDMTDWRAKLTDSMQPMEKSARVKMGVEFLYCFVLLLNSLGRKELSFGRLDRTVFGQWPVQRHLSSSSSLSMWVHFNASDFAENNLRESSG